MSRQFIMKYVNILNLRGRQNKELAEVIIAVTSVYILCVTCSRANDGLLFSNRNKGKFVRKFFPSRSVAGMMMKQNCVLTTFHASRWLNLYAFPQ
jgi:hypothetical protein